MQIIKQIAEKVIEGNIADVKTLTKQALEHKESIQQMIEEGFISGLDMVGEKYTNGELFLPEMLMAGMAVQAGMEILRPLLIKSGVEIKGTIVAGTVEGDVHDIGKNIVCMMCEGAGFKVIDLGTDVPAAKFIDTAKANGAEIIAMSALLSTTRANMDGMIKKIRASGLNHRVKIIVGGAPLTQDFADSVGADGYAPDAGLAVKKARELLGIV
jgi:5-methyltetrahydrofolate--homocysteine methyltransferase